jgi:hypothetical protein
MIKSIKIIMPDNPEIKNFLKREFVEYTGRVEKIKQLHPEYNPQLYYDSIPGYKAFIIKSLLSFGKVETKQIASEIKEEFGWLDTRLFNLAAKVIYDYCNTGGKNVKMVPWSDLKRK